MSRSRLQPLAAVLASTVVFGACSSLNAARMAPCWGQDLAFFHQLIHSAASGGPWSTPLLLEPRGFFDMVHTHLVLPLVIAAYRAVPLQETLLFSQALFASLCLWPAYRLGEAVAPRGGGWLAVGSLVLFGPFQGLAMADFRPSALFLPGVMGVWVAARQRSFPGVVGWAVVALMGRQEAVYLLGVVAGVWLVLPTGPLRGRSWLRRWWTGLHLREGAVLMLTSLLAASLFVVWKPAMFFHFNPLARPAAAALTPDHLADRLSFLHQLARSGLVAGALAPTAWVPLLPVAREMLETGREWGPVVGPAAHYAAFWLPFAAIASISGAGRWAGRWGLGLVLVLNATSVAWPGLRSGPVHLASVSTLIPSDARVAADYDTIHRLAGRTVLWNTAQLRMPENERPRGWVGAWPVPPGAVDYVVAPVHDPFVETLTDWPVVADLDTHRIWARPPTVEPVDSPYGVDLSSLSRPNR